MLDEILARLHKVKSVGANKYKACCPVHDDNSPSMYIKEVDDKILMFCFSCQATGVDVVRSLGMPMSVLFNGVELISDNFIPQRIKDKSMEAVFFIDLYEQARKDGMPLTLKDKRGYQRAQQLRGVYERIQEGIAGGTLDTQQVKRAIPDAFR